MTSTRDVLKAEQIEKVVEQLHQRCGGQAAPESERFVRRFYEPVAPDDVLWRTPDDLLGGALSLWETGARRPPGEAVVRVFNPVLQEHGWASPHSVVEVVNDDMPFLVDSVTSELGHYGLDLHLVVHPIVRVERDADGERQASNGGDGAVRESYIYLEVDRLPGERELDRVRGQLEEVLTAVRAAVEDWKPMLERLAELIAELEAGPKGVAEAVVAEAAEFLRWLASDHFTFLGFRDYRLLREGDDTVLEAVDGSGLGILRDEFRPQRARRRVLPPDMARFAHLPEPLIVTKSDARSVVHRPVHMDYVAVRQFDADGEVVGERRFLGLFTSLAYSRRARSVPLLAHKVERVIERAGFSPASHDAKTLEHILESYPRDELFQITDEQLLESAIGILRLQERRRLALFVRPDTFQRFVSCLVFVPRDRHDTALRQSMQGILEKAFEGKVTALYTQLGDEPLARIHYIVKTTPGAVPDYDVKAIETSLAEAARSWTDDLRRVLVENLGEEQGLALIHRYGAAFPVAYRETFKPETGGFDVERIEEVLASGRPALNLYRPLGLAPEAVRFKIYSPGELVPLTQVVPLLEDPGFEVISEVPYKVEPEGAEGAVWVRDFELLTADGSGVDLGHVREPLHETFLRVARGEMESDAFNRLVLSANLSWRQVMVLQAYCKYLRQTGIAFSRNYMAQTLARNAGVARSLVELFAARFDPTAHDRRREEELVAEIQQALEAVSSLDEDRILRRFLNLVESTLRTTFYQTDDAGEPRPYLAFKLDSQKLAKLPEPRPMYEIFVYSARVEAVHLRSGPVARGGIRWSDRRADFRTEILGLLKAQRVKNAVIVPVGAKGGFVVKRPPAERKAQLEEGVACYQLFIHALLDLTDNIAGGEVVPPPQVVRHDGDDPYLVVAADKGTATFSDIANAIAVERGFWLGDAFASGGSAGYDHKKMGITARGAWESVKRHFREQGKDIQNEDFTVVGVGDMSGDVFGNGMLLSPHIGLLGAFNHLHIFVDPDPDPAVGFAERQRLFELPRSSWTDYDAEKISAGGGVFERSAKAIPVSPEMRQRLGLEGDTVTPNELIRALLSAQVDLLWFGGIGTYVKASDESHAQVGDRANEAVRIDATEVKARVVGEGANLGLTQRARIELARGGGRINTDAIDNSGGVDCSDHEVNIKILLGEAVKAGDLTLKQRDKLLVEMTDEVGELVLRDNYLQTQSITVVEAQGAAALGDQAHLMRQLERAGRLDRVLERLPDEEALAERQAAGQGLTRPEIAVLLAYSKIALFEAILASDLPDDPQLADDLALYFPAPLRKRYATALQRHRLRREIVATSVANSLVNRVGPTFFYRMAAATGQPAAEVARAYTAARDAFELRILWAEIEALDNRVPAEVQTAMALQTRRLVERATLWLLRRRDVDASRFPESHRAAVATLTESLEELVSGADLAQLRRRQASYVKRGVPEELARRVARVDALAAAFPIVRLAAERQRPVEEVGRVYFLAGARFGLDWLRGVAARLEGDTVWEREAVTALADELFALQSELADGVLAAAADGASARAAIDAWASGRSAHVQRIKELLADLRAASKLDLAMLTVARHQLAELLKS